MTFLAPAWLGVAAAVAALVVALHFLARRRPRAAPLPTARFVPDLPARAPSVALRPTDLVPLALRVAAVLAVGAALAGPVLTHARRPVARVVAVDVSRAVRSLAEAGDSALAVTAAEDRVILFDSTARLVSGHAADTLTALAGAGRAARRAPGSLTAALVLAVRAAADLRDRADSLELVIVSPLAREEWDRATADVRALWNARARLVRIALAELPPAPWITLDAPPDDPLRATVALLGAAAGAATPAARAVGGPRTGVPRTGVETRILRRAPAARDTAWARESGGALVVWPMDPATMWPRDARTGATGAATHPGAGAAGATVGAAGDTVGAAGDTVGAAGDTVGAVVYAATGAADPLVVVSAFPRGAAAPAGVPLARWVDGESAAVERPLGAGCERDVAISVAGEGDLALRESLRRLVAALAEPCGGMPDLAPLPDRMVAMLSGGPALLPARRVAPARRAAPPPATAWLLVVAAGLLLLETLARSRSLRPAPEAA